MSRFWQRVVSRFDFIVYRLAYKSLDRMMRRGDGGFAYLFELQLRAWRERNPLPDQLASATERFHETLRESATVPSCDCHTCRPVTLSDMRFVVCSVCGNKRCPKANDHRHECSGSNESGQKGSAWEHVTPTRPQEPTDGRG